MSYFPYEGLNGFRFSKTDEKDNESENNFFIIYRYLKKISADTFIENSKKTKMNIS